MTRGRLIFAIIAAAVAGALVAGVVAFWFFGKFSESAVLAQTQASIVEKGKALEHLRAGRVSEAERLLTTVLDGDLMSAYYLAKDGWKLGEPTLQQIAIEKTARAETGYKPADPEVRSVVESALNLTKK